MDIKFNKPRLKALLESKELMKQRYSVQAAKQARRRITALRAASNLHELPRQGSLHPLHGDRKGQFAFSLGGKLRLIFVPDQDPVPRLADGGIDRRMVTRVTILEITDYHD